MGLRLAAGPGRDAGIIIEGCGSGSSQSMVDMGLAFVYKADCAQPSKWGPTDKNHQGQSWQSFFRGFLSPVDWSGLLLVALVAGIS